tara:strand:+ start:6045 stop:8048 length:2004 start_codon:yes stop_codon:yes gene_type:complete
MILYDSKNKKIELSESNYITSGGEGFIYKVKNQVAKIYKENAIKKEKKIKLIISKKIITEGFCLPSDLLYDSKQNFRGYLMPFAKGKQLQFSVFGISRLKKYFPKWTRIDLCDLALTILEKINEIHKKEILIGDINPMNIHVLSTKEVYFLDTDSYQIDEMPCSVGTLRFTAPEIQDIIFKNQLRTKEHEYYAITTLLFMIFFPGKSPYDSIGGDNPKKSIKHKNFSYPFGDDANYKAPKGPWEYIWNDLPFNMKKSFYLTFSDTNKLYRFPPENWISTIKNYKRDLLYKSNDKTGIIPYMSEKMKDNVTTGMGRDVRKIDQYNYEIKTVLDKISTKRKIGVLELSTKAVKLLIGSDEIIKSNGFSFSLFPIKKGILTNTGNLLDGNNNMNLEQFKAKVIPAVKSLLILAKENKITELYTVATAAYRASNNRKKIVDVIKKEVGVNVKILSKAEEARVTLVAFIHSKPKEVNQFSNNKIMIDQGGGSTEVTLFNNQEIISSYSLNSGTTIMSNILLSQTNQNTNLKEGLLHSDKITKGKLKYYFKTHAPIISKDTLCFGTGTAITKGTLQKVNSTQHGYIFTQKMIKDRIYYFEKYLIEKFKNVGDLNTSIENKETLFFRMTAQNILSIRLGLPVYLEIMRALNIEQLIVSSTSLWYGVYFDNLYNK